MQTTHVYLPTELMPTYHSHSKASLLPFCFPFPMPPLWSGLSQLVCTLSKCAHTRLQPSHALRSRVSCPGGLHYASWAQLCSWPAPLLKRRHRVTTAHQMLQTAYTKTSGTGLFLPCYWKKKNLETGVSSEVKLFASLQKYTGHFHLLPLHQLAHGRTRWRPNSKHILVRMPSPTRMQSQKRKEGLLLMECVLCGWPFSKKNQHNNLRRWFPSISSVQRTEAQPWCIAGRGKVNILTHMLAPPLNRVAPVTLRSDCINFVMGGPSQSPLNAPIDLNIPQNRTTQFCALSDLIP